MIADRTSNLTVESNIQGEKIALGIHEGAMAHIMSVLTDLYSDPELAVLREYSTNGLDAQIEAGINRPIEVSTPSPLSPFFKVRDFGVGLSVEDIHAIYSQYGASTKRGTNDQVGMLGLGCKSALTYTNQFTVTSVKDGVRVQVAVSRDDDGTGSMTVVDTQTTSDPNGTEIVVPAKQHNSFEHKAREFFRYWSPGTVLLNGSDPSGIDGGIEITPEITLVEGLRESRIVMGNVAYPCRTLDSYSLGIAYNYAIVARVPIGAVNFTPSREALHYTPKTEACVADIRQTFKDNARGAIEKLVQAAANHREAIKLLTQWSRVLSNVSLRDSIKYRGTTIPYTLDFPAPHPIVIDRNSHKLSASRHTDKITTEIAANAVFLYGFDKGGWTATMKKKLIQWADAKGVVTQHYIVMPKRVNSQWIAADQWHDWAEVQAQKLPRNAPSPTTGRIPGSYDCYVGTDYYDGLPADDIDQSYPVLYIEGNYRDGRAAARVLESLGEEFTLVCLSANRVEKFKRNFPKAEGYRGLIQAAHDKWWKTITKEQRMALVMQGDYYTSRILRSVPLDKLDDPALAAAVKLSKLDVSSISDKRRMFCSYIEIPSIDGEWTNPLDAYPLVNENALRHHAEESVEYMNFKFAQRQAKKA